MVEEDLNVVPYKDISELKKQLDVLQEKKDVSPKDLYDAVQKLAAAMSDLLDVFGAAAEQLRIEEKEREIELKKHEIIIAKLDKLVDQNRTIAEGMVAVVELVKEKFGSDDKEEPVFRPAPMAPQPMPNFSRQVPQPKMQAMPPIAQGPSQPMTPPMMPPTNPMGQNGLDQMPPMQPAPMPDLDLPEEPLLFDEGEKKKKLFGMFKK